VKVLDRQVFDRGGPSHEQAFLIKLKFENLKKIKTKKCVLGVKNEKMKNPNIYSR
jgi:hypothetical protein